MLFLCSTDNLLCLELRIKVLLVGLDMASAIHCILSPGIVKLVLRVALYVFVTCF